MEKWCVDKLCDWLREIEMKEEIVDLFRREEIDGDVIHTIDVSSLLALVPELKRGPAHKIIRARNEFTKAAIENNNPVSEVRPFGSSTKGCSYILGSTLVENGVRVEESGPDLQNLLKPAREFKSNPSGEIDFFVNQTLRFITACLNTRVNGVIHFGVKNSTAEVLGCRIPCLREDYKDKLEEKISSCFQLPEIRRILRSCMSYIKFIEVSNSDEPLYVMEVEIEPKHVYCEERYFKIDLTKIGKELAGRDYDKMVILVRQGSSSKPILKEDNKTFLEKTLPDFIKRRKMVDQVYTDMHSVKAESLRQILKDERILDYSTFPVLVLDKPNNDFDEHELHFICDIKWRVVFDFDNTNRLQRQYISDGCSTTWKSPESLSEDLSILNRISGDPTTCWISANGNEATKADSYRFTMWKEKRFVGIVSTLLQIRNLSLGRAFIVFLFFDDHEGFISETYDTFVNYGFENQLLYIAETISALEFLHEKVSDANIKPDIHGIIGLPWSHVAGIFNNVCGKSQSNCEVPSSSSAPIALNRNDYAHLEILGINECKDIGPQSISEAQYLEKKYEFYKGNMVSWDNIALSEERFSPDDRHVVKRDIYEDLKKKVQRCLDGKGNPAPVDVVTVYYQPGSGASTLTRHVLWSFRKDYKCAVVSNTISVDTRSQIMKLYLHGDQKVPDENRKPVLILLDVSDEDLSQSFIEDLPYVSPQPKNLFCVVIRTCSRTTRPPKFLPTHGLYLQQYLSENEMDCFQKCLARTEQQLETEHDYKPDNMLAFLIFKNQFQTQYIKDCVSKYLGSQDIRDWERPILKYIALMNTYFHKSPEIPISFFDSIAPDLEELSHGLKLSNKFKQESSAKKWWYTLSNSFQLFCIKVEKYTLGTVNSFKIVHPLLAKEILKQLLRCDNQRISDALLEFITSHIFKSNQSHSRNSVVEMTRNMIKHRKPSESGNEQQFAPIIAEILESDGNDAALTVMKKAFEVLVKEDQQDAYLAQQIARICILSKPLNLCEAERYAKLALSLKPHNSYLLDTIGQVYKTRLKCDFQTYEVDGEPLSLEKSREAILLAQLASENFRRSVEYNQKEENINYCGYVGELQVYQKLLELLQCVPMFSGEEGKGILIRFLHDQNYIPDECSAIWEDIIEFLKQLPDNIENALTSILDCLTKMQYRDVQHTKQSWSNPKQNILGRVTGYRFFFEKLLWKLPLNEHFQNPITKCQLNRAKVKEMGGIHFSNIFMLGYTESGQKLLLEMDSLLRENINLNRGPINEFDSRTIILVSMAIALFDTGKQRLRPDINPEYICRLCKTYIAAGVGNLNAPNLFLSMLLWPRADMKIKYDHKFYMQILSQLREEGNRMTKKGAPNQSRVAAYQSSGRRITAFRMATHFFLGKGEGLCAIVHQNKIQREVRADTRRAEFWNSIFLQSALAKLQGVRKGRDILAFNDLEKGEDYRIPVKIAFPSPSASEEPVEFYLGFSWGGPVAYDVQPISTRLTRDLIVTKSRESYDEFVDNGAAAGATELTFVDFTRQRDSLQRKINKSQKEEEKSKWSKKLDELKQRYIKQEEDRDFEVLDE